jgi:peptidoglycan/LPS O-acetylase OafA/YrhL
MVELGSAWLVSAKNQVACCGLRGDTQRFSLPGRDMTEARNPRYYSLDAWRGLACLIVVIFHANIYVVTPELVETIRDSENVSVSDYLLFLTTRFWYGVPLFFVISGYCISASMDRHQQRAGSVRSYFLRRFRRIFPTLWVFLAVAIPLTAFIGIAAPMLMNDDVHGFWAPWWFSSWQWIGSLTLTESWRHHVIGDGKGLLFGHLWTLCYEEQFYAIAGVCLFLAPKHFTKLIAAITAGVAVMTVLAPNHPSTYGFFFDGLWLQFAAGVGVYQVLIHGTRKHAIALVGLLFAAAAQQFWQMPSYWEMDHHLQESNAVAFLFAVVLLGLHRFDAAIASSRLLAPFTSCGMAFYSIYLVHAPLVKGLSHSLYLLGFTSPFETLLVTIPSCLVVSIVLGQMFHRCVEQRFLNSSAAPSVVPSIAPMTKQASASEQELVPQAKPAIV